MSLDQVGATQCPSLCAAHLHFNKSRRCQEASRGPIGSQSLSQCSQLPSSVRFLIGQDRKHHQARRGPVQASNRFPPKTYLPPLPLMVSVLFFCLHLLEPLRGHCEHNAPYLCRVGNGMGWSNTKIHVLLQSISLSLSLCFPGFLSFIPPSKAKRGASASMSMREGRCIANAELLGFT